jgi:hypothetical protein
LKALLGKIVCDGRIDSREFRPPFFLRERNTWFSPFLVTRQDIPSRRYEDREPKRGE